MEYRKGYNYSENQPHLWNETSASKVLVMNQGLEVVDCDENVGAKV